MSLKVIYVVRHGFRSNWVVDPKTGTYTSSIPTPTGIPSDPALAGKGVDQADQLASHLVTLSPPIDRIYSSPFYRCIQTIAPTVALLNKPSSVTSDPNRKDEEKEKENKQRPMNVRLENGIGEWYGKARFDHPSPASPSTLAPLFAEGLVDTKYKPEIIPSVNGETIQDLHNRTAYALHRIIQQADAENVTSILICTHAATLIAIGRTLTGRMPVDVEEEDFRPFTCGLSKFERKVGKTGEEGVKGWEGEETKIPKVQWEGGQGVGGGWLLSLSGDCSFLKEGEERGWRFSGDESFDTAGLVKFNDAGSGLGVVIEGKKNSPSRL